MTSKLTITRERLQEIAEDGFLKHGESKELARIALAAMDSESRKILEVNVGGNTWVQCSEKAYENAKSKGELTRVLYEPSQAIDYSKG
ncbi:hypothetical protein HJX59_27125 (plasmid) [Klebsiella pneumoniae]|nr:hypothetical protein HJX59_27125 [Klebsiella pneumoniae]